ncbi:MAG: hypothetical protein HKN91_05195 [Acidimicrobiia bacterium]|nr:hypothetical protein [Acidimicrobiia bacterium]
MGVRFIRKARVNDGKRDEAIAFATDIAEHWNATYGTHVTWGFEIGGDQGTLYWMSDHSSLAALEEQMLASMDNAETNKRLAEGIGLFGPAQDKLVYTMS